MKYYNNLPLYGADIDDEGIMCISLVEHPAMQLPMFYFSADGEVKKEEFKFGIDELKHNIVSCIIRADFPIYRENDKGEGYYLVFSAENIEKIKNTLMVGDNLQKFSLRHNDDEIDGVELVEVFTKNTQVGMSPIGFDDAANGSLFGIFHITNETIWNECMNGTLGGVSMEIGLSIKEIFENKINNNTDMSKIKEMLKAVLAEFDAVETDKGQLTWEGDKQLEVGDAVFQNGQPAPDGEYTVDDKVFVVVDGKVAEVRDMAVPNEEGNKVVEEEMECGKKKMEEATAEPKEEPATEPTEPVDEVKEQRMADLETKVEDLYKLIEELKAKIAEIALQPAAKPVEEDFEDVTNKDNVKTNTKQDKYINMFLAK